MPDTLLADNNPGANRAWQILDPRRSLRIRVVTVVTVSARCFTGLTVWVAGVCSRRQLEQQIGLHLEALAFQVVDKLDRVMSERGREIESAIGQVPLRVPGAPVDERRRALDAIRDASPEFAWIGLANPAGTVIFATQHQFEGAQVETQRWFRNARNRPYAGDVHEEPGLASGTAPTAGQQPLFVDLSTPVLSAAGQFLGVLGARLSWAFAREVQLSVVSDTMAQRDRVGLTLYSVNGDVLLDSGVSGWNEPPGAPELPDRHKPRGFILEHPPDGSAYVTGYAHSRGYRDFGGLGWFAVVRQPMAVALAPAADLQRVLLRTGLAVTAAAALLAWILTAHLIRQLRSVAASARRIGDGDILAVLPRPPGRGDLPDMCAALGEMVRNLRIRQEQLEAENLRQAARLHAQEKPPKL
jgi:HAMP domain-containing protein